MTRAIVSDLGRVLLGIDTEPGWTRLQTACECPDQFRATLSRLHDETGLQAGRVTARQFYERVARECRLRVTFEEFCRLWSDQFWEESETIELICRAPVEKLILLSNTNAIHWDWITARHGDMLARFDRLITSHEVGLEKPDPAIYRLVIEETGFAPQEHLFIDDLEANLEGARAVGMDTILHTDADSLRRQLQARGLA